MSEKLVLPQFTSEAEEAQWWFDHQDELLEEFILAESEGRLGRGTIARRAQAEASTVVLDREDVQRAQALASKRGMEYGDYVKSVVHQALLREEQSA